MLQAKLIELGPTHSFEDGKAAVEECIQRDFHSLLSDTTLADIIRENLNNTNLTFSDSRSEDATYFDFIIEPYEDQLPVSYTIAATHDERSYIVRANFPCKVDPMYAMPVALLCQKLHKELPIGCNLLYSQDEGIVCLDYTHILDIYGTIDNKLFDDIIVAMYDSIMELNPLLTRFATGKLRHSEYDDLYKACEMIIADLEEQM